MKKRLNLKSLVVGGIIGALLSTGVGYATSQLTSIEVSMEPITFIYNEQQLELEEGQHSFIYEGATYVPLRWLSESLGKNVAWDAEQRTIYFTDPAEEDEAEVIDENENEQEAEGVAAELSLDKDVYTAQEIAELKLVNQGANTLTFGRPFALELLQDNKWVEVPLELAFTMELIVLSENDQFTQQIDLSQLELAEGTYRVVKFVYDEDAQEQAKLSFTFDIVSE